MRPSTSRPTGIWMGAPVFFTAMPRTRPSVVSMAMQRTVFSPRCCATSTTRLSGSSLIDGVRDPQRGVDLGQLAGAELDVDDGADDLDDPALAAGD